MNRRTIGLIITLALSLLVAPLAAEAQSAGKVARIGFLWSSSPHLGASFLDAFRQGLREFGYAEGQNLAIEHRYAEGRYERLPTLAAELVQLQADIIVTQGTPAAHAAKQATSSIPIVMTNVGNPVASGLVANLARPGGNITGLSLLAAELSRKRLELLKEAVPGISRVAVLRDVAGGAQITLTLRETQVAAQALGLQLQILEVQGPHEVESALGIATRDRAEALLVLPSAVLNFHRKPLVDLAAKSRLPAMYQAREFVDAGGLMAYGPSIPDLFRRAAAYVDKILKGAKPADLPVEQPTKFELVINLKTAQALGLTIPATLLFQADAIIR